MQHDSEAQKALLLLVQNALWSTAKHIDEADWDTVEHLANHQGVLSMIYKGIPKGESCIPKERAKVWRAHMFTAVVNNEQLLTVQQHILEWFAEQQLDTVILKGTSSAFYYQCPDIRALGDIDLLIDPKRISEIDGLLRKHNFVPMQDDHDFHDSYHINGVVVEIHRLPSDYPESEGGLIAKQAMDCFLKEKRMVHINAAHFPTLSIPHHALMLLMHMERHLLVSGIGLRQLCDWAAYVGRLTKTQFETEVMPLIKACGLWEFAKILTRTCVDYLGLCPTEVPWCLHVGADVSSALMDIVFVSGNMGRNDGESIPRLFADREKLGSQKRTLVERFREILNERVAYHFPVADKFRFIKPFFAVYILIRYMMRSVFRKKGHRKVSHALSAAHKRQLLFDKMQLYEIKQ